MRVHPTVLQGSKSKIPLIAGGVFVFLLLAANLFKSEAPALPPPVPMQIVAVAKLSIGVHEAFTPENVGLEERPVSTLPPEPLTVLEELKDKKALGVIPPNSVITRALILDPSVTTEPAKLAEPVAIIDPCDNELAEIRKHMVSIPITFQSSAPARCTRLAMSVQTPKGIAPIVDEAIVEKLEGNLVRILVNPDRAPVIDQAKFRGGVFSYVEVPKGVLNPYAGQTVADVAQLASYFGDPADLQPKVEEKKEEVDGCTGFAKIGDTIYCTKEGKVYIYNPETTKLIETKKEYFLKDLKPLNNSEQKSGKSLKPEPTTAIEEEAELEPLYPVTGLGQ